MDARIKLSQALAEAAELVDRSGQVAPSLREVAEVAENSVTGFDHVSITLLHPDGRFETGAWTSPLALELDNAQYALGEGPCVDTARGGQVLTVPGLRFEGRWPSYVPQAVAMGVQSHLSVRLTLDRDATLGSLNFYSTTTATVSRESEAVAELFGYYGATSKPTACTPVQPSPTLEAVRVVGQALGIVMNRLDLDANRAFDHLDQSADRAGQPLPEYAQQLVDEDGLS